jgi:uncharacterized membrane protein YcaP (DUF421 family)
MLCKYQYIFGKAGKGIHSYRIFNLAILDILGTILGAYIIHWVLPKYKFLWILLFLFILGILLHRLFCVRTTIDKWIFG